MEKDLRSRQEITILGVQASEKLLSCLKRDGESDRKKERNESRGGKPEGTNSLPVRCLPLKMIQIDRKTSRIYSLPEGILEGDALS